MPPAAPCRARPLPPREHSHEEDDDAAPLGQHVDGPVDARPGAERVGAVLGARRLPLQSGACFYEDINYGGRYFCTRVGDSNPRVPSNINDEISSIRLFGDAEVVVFRDDNMRGEIARVHQGVRDMRRSRFNDRLTSYVVQPRGYGNGNWGGDGNSGYNGTAATTAPVGNSGYNGMAATTIAAAAATTTTTAAPTAAARTGAAARAAAAGRCRRPNRWCGRATAVSSAATRTLGARGWVEQVMTNNWSQRQLEEALRNSAEGRSR